MGSMFAKLQTISVSHALQTDLTEKHPNYLSDANSFVHTYDATLLNCQLRAVCKGKLEIRSSDLLFSDGRSELVWPLCSLRWYGRDSRHFVFESGHRSPYGRGLLFFKCKNPKRLTQCVDERINAILQQNQTPDSQTMSDKHSLNATRRRTQPSLVKLVFHIPRGKRCQSEKHVDCRSQEVTSAIAYSPEQSNTGRPSVSTALTDSSTGVRYSLLQSVPMCEEDLTTSPSNPANCGLANATQHGTRSNGRYLIAAAAPHSYVNQPNCRFTATAQDIQWLASCDDTNDYVPEPS